MKREGIGESHERESMTEGGSVFINREIEVEELEVSMERKQKRLNG